MLMVNCFGAAAMDGAKPAQHMAAGFELARLSVMIQDHH